MVLAIGGGSQNEQAQRALFGAALPVHRGNLFIAHLAALAAIEDLGGFPDDVLVLAHLLGVELFEGVKPAGILGGAEA